MKGLHVAVVGASGAVGRAMLKVMEEKDFPVAKITLLASKRSAGSVLYYKGEKQVVSELKEESFQGVDLALFSAGSSVSQTFAQSAVDQGAVVIDNSSAFRMNQDVPLIVPEVNPDAVTDHHRLIANPNCSTIQMVVALKPIYDAVGIEQVVVSTYQSVSGAGNKAVEELKEQTQALLDGSSNEPVNFPHPIAFNIIPHIDAFLENGYTKEEMKMVDETKKIFADQDIRVSPTAARVPVMIGHSESIYIKTKAPIEVKEAVKIWDSAPGVAVIDDAKQNQYPLPIEAAGRDEVLIGRIRKDLHEEKALNFWVVADNLRKGAATNAVQIAELIIKKERV